MKKITGIFILLALGSVSISSAMASDWKTYRVTITNATSHHVITPPLIVVHNSDFKLFEVTAAASDGLATQAETGNPAELYNEVVDAEGVYEVITGNGVIVYGNKATFEIRAPKKAMISMLSNFFGIFFL